MMADKIFRIENWEAALIAVPERYSALPFELGKTDCAHFAFDCAEAVLGRDIMGSFRNSYTGRLSGAARLHFRGCRTVAQGADYLIKAAGGFGIDPRAARVGDIGATADDILAVRFPHGFVARGTDGKFYKTPVVRAWYIGEIVRSE